MNVIPFPTRAPIERVEQSRQRFLDDMLDLVRQHPDDALVASEFTSAISALSQILAMRPTLRGSSR